MIFERQFWATGVVLVALLAVSACSDVSGPEIVGSWEAEDIRVDSLIIQLGPRLEISPTEVFMPGQDVRLPIAAIERDAPEKITLRFAPSGQIPRLGWTMYFESADRIRMDIPLTGPLYYRRVKDKASEGAEQPPAAANGHPKPENPLVSAATAPVPVQPSSTTSIQDAVLDMVAAALQRDDADSALRILSGTLSTGAVVWPSVERDPRLLMLRQDVHYQALMGRYR